MLYEQPTENHCDETTSSRPIHVGLVSLSKRDDDDSELAKLQSGLLEPCGLILLDNLDMTISVQDALGRNQRSLVLLGSAVMNCHR